MRRYIRTRAIKKLPEGYPVDVHFNPRYDPWDQRVCLDADGDLFASIRDGATEVVTDTIERFDATGIWLASGTHLRADVVVTATGLALQALGGVRVSLDGTGIDPAERFVYKAHLIEDVPNLAWCVGYTNASWTLRADMTAKSVAKLLSHMSSHGYTHAYPHRGDLPLTEKPSWDINAGYVQRARHTLPKSGTKRPWHVRQNYFADAIDHRFDRIGPEMVFGRSAASSTSPAGAVGTLA
jgi:cation diffusion facilitator CzcD-associated flavoprotein CzcO